VVGKNLETRFEEYGEVIGAGLAHADRRKQAGVPREIDFRTKGAIALEQIEQGIAAGLPPGIVLADAAYGTEADWRDQLTAWGLSYAVGVREYTQVWSGAHRPAAMPAASPRGGRPRTRLRIDARPRPLPVLELAQQLPASTALKHLVAMAMGRWRIEREYQELKSELGLHHYAGRNWRGFHHHASLCIAAYGFLMRERLRSRNNSAQFKTPAVPTGFRPRGSGPNAATRPNFDRHHRVLSLASHRRRASDVSVLRQVSPQAASILLTQ
jgi:SRSO17 transposase